MRTLRMVAASLVGWVSLVASTAAALAFPDRPVSIIVPWAAGGGADTVTRFFAAGLETELGVPVAVVNRTGGGGITGHTTIATATPDGYTLGAASPEIAFYKALGLGELTPDSVDLFSRIGLLPAGVTVKADAPHAAPFGLPRWPCLGRDGRGDPREPLLILGTSVALGELRWGASGRRRGVRT